MKHKPKSKMEMMAELRAQKVSRMNPQEAVLEQARRNAQDYCIQLGHNIAHGLDLIELMMLYDMTDEELIYFHEKHEEFLNEYESHNEDDKKEIMDMFDELKKRTGYDVLEGRIPKKEGIENEVN